MAGTKPYPQELRERAVRMVAEVRPNYESDWAAINAARSRPAGCPASYFVAGTSYRQDAAQPPHAIVGAVFGDEPVAEGHRPISLAKYAAAFRRMRTTAEQLRHAAAILYAQCRGDAERVDGPTVAGFGRRRAGAGGRYRNACGPAGAGRVGAPVGARRGRGAAVSDDRRPLPRREGPCGGRVAPVGRRVRCGQRGCWD
jgi:transposase